MNLISLNAATPDIIPAEGETSKAHTQGVTVYELAYKPIFGPIRRLPHCSHSCF